MAAYPPPLVDVLPGEQQRVSLDHALNEIRAEVLADGAAVFVVDHAARLVEHFPAALPRHIAQVGIFEVKGRIQFVETAERKEFAPVERARSTAAVEAGKQPGDRRVGAMTHAQCAVLPPALREAGLLADLAGIREKDLAGDGEHGRVGEAFEQRREKTRLHAHVVIEEHNDIVLRLTEARVRAATEAEVPLQGHQSDLREMGPHISRAVIGRSVIDDDDLIGRVAGQRGDDGGQIAFQQVAPVPVRDHDAGRRGGRRRLRRIGGRSPDPAHQQRKGVGKPKSEKAGGQQKRREQQQRQRAQQTLEEEHVNCPGIRGRDRPSCPA